jgi:hypothetical protein
MVRLRRKTILLISFVIAVVISTFRNFFNVKESIDLLSNGGSSVIERPEDVSRKYSDTSSSSSLRMQVPPLRDRIRRISYTLHPKSSRPYTNEFEPFTKCDLNEKKKGRVGLPAEMKNETGFLDFTTSVTTDLKILFMGDSVSIQYSQGFEEAAGALHAHRGVIRYSWGTHEGLHVSAPVRGGVVVAGWRMTGLLSRKGENKPLPNSPRGGWVRKDVRNLTSYTYNVTND